MRERDDTTLRARFFAAVAGLGTRRPGLVLAIAGLFILLGALLIPGIRVSTSRIGLVSANNPYQARLLQFYERFGYPETPILVVEGASPEDRRRFIDHFARRLEDEPALALKGRVLARLGPNELAEVLLLQRPELFASLRGKLAPEGEAPAILAGGLPAWIGAIDAQVQAALDGKGDDKAGATEDGLRSLAVLARALDDELAEKDGGARLAELGRKAGADAMKGVDDEGYLVAADGSFHVVAMFPELAGDEGEEVKPVIERIRAIRDATIAEHEAPGLETHLTGLPALVTDELGIIQKGLLQSSLVSTAAILLLLIVVFRSARITVLSLVPLGAGALITLGAVRLIYGELNLVTSGFVSVLLGLGIDFGVYLLSRYSEIRRSGASSAEAARGALVRAGPGMVTGAVTTMLAFLTTVTVEFTAYAELGVITAVGLFVMIAAAFLLMPALVRVTGGASLRPAPELPGMAALTTFIRRARFAILGLAVIAAVIGMITLRHIRFNGRYFDFLPARTESSLGLKLLETDQTLSPTFANLSAESIEEARAMAERLRALPTVASVQTGSDLLPRLDEKKLAELRVGVAALPSQSELERLRAQHSKASDVRGRIHALRDSLDEIAFALRQSGRDTQAITELQEAFDALDKRLEGLPGDGREAIGRIEMRVASVLERASAAARAVVERGGYAPSDLPPLFRARFVSRDGKAIALYAYPAGDAWEPAVAKRFAADVEGIDPKASGPAITVYQHERMIVDGFLRAAAIAILLVLLVLLVDFRDARIAALALVPLVVGWLGMAALMRLVGLSFDVANIVALPLLLGIGIDAGAHIVHRYRESAEANGGIARLDELLRGTGGAVLLASMTTMAGFAALMVADYGAMKSFGLIMTIGMASCLVSSIVVLPALLCALGRAR